MDYNHSHHVRAWKQYAWEEFQKRGFKEWIKLDPSYYMTEWDWIAEFNGIMSDFRRK